MVFWFFWFFSLTGKREEAEISRVKLPLGSLSQGRQRQEDHRSEGSLRRGDGSCFKKKIKALSQTQQQHSSQMWLCASTAAGRGRRAALNLSNS